jgi:hypothetical protein
MDGSTNNFDIIFPKGSEIPFHADPAHILEMTDVHAGSVFIYHGAPGVVFVDVDGTVADLTHRRVFVATKPKNWPAFEKTIHLDTPIQPVIDAVRRLWDAGWKVVICTGRGAQNRAKTIAWLEKHGVPFHAIYTRAEKDYRPDNIIKAELLVQARLDGYDPDVVFDDRNQVVDMWRANNIPCVQVAEGDF